MIKLSENRVALLNIRSTIEALETLKELRAYYSETPLKVGPAYVTFRYTNLGNLVDAQIDRAIMVECLTDQIARLEDYLATLGIDAKE